MNPFIRSWSRFAFIALASMVMAPASPASVTLGVHDGALRSTGIVWDAPLGPSFPRVIDGPMAVSPGFAAAEGPVEIGGTLVEPVTDRGAFMFWLRTDRTYRSGREAEKFTQKIAELRDTLSVRFTSDGATMTLTVDWQAGHGAAPARQMRIILPEWPGPEWHHVVVQWDGPKGEMNVFLDGTPYHLPGIESPPWPVRAGTGLVLHLDRFALADVRLQPDGITEADLRAIVGEAKWGELDTLLGARDHGPAPADSERGELLYHRALGDPVDMRDWVMEGPATIEHRGGWMQLQSERPDGPEGHLVYWCPVEFPESFRAEWEFELIGENGLCIVFFAARGHGGRELFDPALAPRNGIFRQYTHGDIDSYHISYFAHTPLSPRRVTNLRKNNGATLIANGPVGVTAAGEGPHRAILIKDGNHIRMAVDGRTIIDYTDDGERAGPVWAGGKIGLRQMQWTVARYRDFRVYALPVEKPEAAR